MDFALTDEQSMLRDSVDRFVAGAHGFEKSRSIAATPEGLSREDWASFAELGWLMLTIPEELGGIGGSATDAAIIMEGFGKGLVAAPFVSTAVIGVSLLAAAEGCGDREDLLARIGAGELLLALATEEDGSRYDPLAVRTRAAADANGYRIHGSKLVVPDGASADQFLITAMLGDQFTLFLIPADAAGATVNGYRTIDDRRAADLRIDGVHVPASALLMHGEAAVEAVTAAIDRASIMLAAESLGCMAAAIDLTADYLKARQQFGRTLSQFQVLTHRVSDMFVKYENARSMVLRGLASLPSGSAARGAGVSATMISALQAGEFICGQGIQLHGGIGMAEEAPIGHYYKRIRAIGRTYGDPDYHMQRYIRLSAEQGRAA